jgi:hypothetical protein
MGRGGCLGCGCERDVSAGLPAPLMLVLRLIGCCGLRETTPRPIHLRAQPTSHPTPHTPHPHLPLSRRVFCHCIPSNLFIPGRRRWLWPLCLPHRLRVCVAGTGPVRPRPGLRVRRVRSDRGQRRRTPAGPRLQRSRGGRAGRRHRRRVGCEVGERGGNICHGMGGLGFAARASAAAGVGWVGGALQPNCSWPRGPRFLGSRTCCRSVPRYQELDVRLWGEFVLPWVCVCLLARCASCERVCVCLCVDMWDVTGGGDGWVVCLS